MLKKKTYNTALDLTRYVGASRLVARRLVLRYVVKDLGVLANALECSRGRQRDSADMTNK